MSPSTASHHELYICKKMNSATKYLSRVEGPQASGEKPALDNTLIEASRRILKQKTQLSRERLLTHRNHDINRVLFEAALWPFVPQAAAAD